ncbi:MAG TPA: hypothetical protein DEA08_28560, partial [Planctomycetes bacterium]|nr:hypothetical protein [Planctomycetota bacterium]
EGKSLLTLAALSAAAQRFAAAVASYDAALACDPPNPEEVRYHRGYCSVGLARALPAPERAVTLAAALKDLGDNPTPEGVSPRERRILHQHLVRLVARHLPQRFADASELLLAGLRQSKPARRCQAETFVAAQAAEAELFSVAVPHYRAALALGPPDPVRASLLASLAHVLVSEGEVDEAFETARSSLQLVESCKAHLAISRAHFARGELDESQDALERAGRSAKRPEEQQALRQMERELARARAAKR